MTLDLALRDRPQLSKLRFLDPSCGSGIFLVLVFNRLVAEWRSKAKKNLSVPEQAEALLERLGRLQGVDRNLTACRITCFSLYLAFLDQFSPADVQQYVAETGHKLPKLLDSPGIKKPNIPVVWHRDFTELDSDWQEPFDVVIGNPPWVGRGSKQIAHRFMELTPKFLKPDGVATLILPTKVFFNKTDAFQKQWMGQVSLETVVQLADFSFILFKGALCPAAIARFTPQAPEADHTVEYIAPKVTLTDLRDGRITVGAQDRKWIPLQTLLAAAEQGAIGMAWKTQLWGTPRDQKLLKYLFSLPRLGEMVGTPAEVQGGGKRWVKSERSQLFSKSYNPNKASKRSWNVGDPTISPDNIKDLLYFPVGCTISLHEHLKSHGPTMYLLNVLNGEELEPPLVLVISGFINASFLDYKVHLMPPFIAFAGPPTDDQALKFLAVFLRSNLARYFAFHTSSNFGTEQDYEGAFEFLRLPFFTPEDAPDPKAAKNILKTVSSRFQSYMASVKKSADKLAARVAKGSDLLAHLKGQANDESIEDLKKSWRAEQKAATEALRKELEPHIYAYFGLTEQDIALVEDTCEIFDRSDTPGSLASAAANSPTLQPVSTAKGLADYAGRLCHTLNSRIAGNVRVVASGMVDQETGLALVELTQAKAEAEFKPLSASRLLLEAADKLQQANVERLGNSLEFQRAGWFFEGKKIYILKPARRGEWTRTAALNDAAELHQHILTARRASRA